MCFCSGTGHVIPAADATDRPRVLRHVTPNTRPRAGALAPDPDPDRPVHPRRSCRRRPARVRTNPAAARAPGPGPDASLEAASARSAFKYCMVQLYIESLCV